jgi:hypothetical protein
MTAESRLVSPRSTFFRITGLLLVCSAAAIGSSAQTLTSLTSFNKTNGAESASLLIQGAIPFALVLSADGNFYGTTSAGGSGDCPTNGISGCGMVFKITSAGALLAGGRV